MRVRLHLLAQLQRSQRSRRLGVVRRREADLVSVRVGDGVRG